MLGFNTPRIANQEIKELKEELQKNKTISQRPRELECLGENSLAPCLCWKVHFRIYDHCIVVVVSAFLVIRTSYGPVP